jgi:glycerophosphoryl diester phosphodiesterase
MFKLTFTIIASLVSSLLFAQANYSLLRIAHAGGQIGATTYTNSIEALDANYEKGFRAFEIDFSWTSDHQLVCMHDWEQSFERSFGLPPTAPISLSDFEELVRDRSAYKKCSLTSFMQWFADHPQALLVTDVKERNLDALEHIGSNYPQFLARIIPQIYQPSEYPIVRELGFEKIIWTLYKFSGGPLAVLNAIQDMELYAIAMNTARAEQNLGQELDALGISSYVHTINDYADSLFFRSLGIDEIYTDSLSLPREKVLMAAGTVTISDSRRYQAKETKSQNLVKQISQFFSMPRVLYSLDENFSSTKITSNQVLFRDSEPGQLKITANGNDPYLNFPNFLNPSTDIKIYIQLNVPDNTTTEVFYTTRSNLNFSELLKMREQVVRGDNEIVISISSPDPITRIRLDPGKIAGFYTIRKLEVRSN